MCDPAKGVYLGMNCIRLSVHPGVHLLQLDPWSVRGPTGLSSLEMPEAASLPRGVLPGVGGGHVAITRSARGDEVGNLGRLTLPRGVEEAPQGTFQQDLELRTGSCQSRMPGGACCGKEGGLA